jgi:hypothetical protein
VRRRSSRERGRGGGPVRANTVDLEQGRRENKREREGEGARC